MAAEGEETNGSLMALMRLGPSVGGGAALAPASKAPGKEAALKWLGRAGLCGGIVLEMLLLLSSISKPLLESKLTGVISLFLQQNSIMVKTAYS